MSQTHSIEGELLLETRWGACLPDWQERRIQDLARIYGRYHPSRGGTFLRLTGPEFGFYPHAGNLWEELYVRYHCDLDPEPDTFFDFDGSDLAYDGHRGHDSLLMDFDPQTIGVPIYAAMDGTVIETDDGHFDRNVVLGDFPSNYVLLSHGNGLTTLYLHMKQGSVAVSAGQVVRAGQQIGSTGSSGRSSWPHLHFQCMIDGEWFEPSAGAMRPGPSNWLNQIPVRTDAYVADAFLTASVQGWNPPNEIARKATYVMGTQTVLNVAALRNLPPLSTWQRIVRDPTGVVRTNSGVMAFNNPTIRRAGFSWFGAASLNLNLAGTWKIQLYINGLLSAEMPFKVVATPEEVVNRPPRAIQAKIDPITPDVDLPVFCRVVGDLIHEDPDYDVMRYRYLWTVDGAVVRDVTIAGRADCIPYGTLAGGQEVSCTVIPKDDTLEGHFAMAVVRSAPGSFSIPSALVIDGSVRDLRFSDDKRLNLAQPPTGARNTPIVVEVVSTVHAGPGPGGAELHDLEFTVETSVNGGSVVQTILLYNYDSQTWVSVDSRAAPDSDTLTSVSIPENLAPQYIGPGKQVRARVMFSPDNPLTFSRAIATIDYVEWAMKPLHTCGSCGDVPGGG